MAKKTIVNNTPQKTINSDNQQKISTYLHMSKDAILACKNHAIWPVMLLLCLFVLATSVKTQSTNQKLELKITELSQALNNKITDNRKVYVFNMATALDQSGINLLIKKFETDVAKLDAEVAEAQNKIESLKDAKVKAEFSEVYINSLRLKRDNLIEEYQKVMDNTLKTINQALVTIAIEKKVPTIFMENITAVKTKDVVDVTPDVVQKIKEKQDSKSR